MTWKNWKDEYKRKLLPSPEEAVKLVKSENWVVLAWGGGCPVALGMALSQRKHELENVIVDTSANMIGDFPWYQPGYTKAFKPRSGHIRNLDRTAHDRKELEFYPISLGTYFRRVIETPQYFSPSPDFFMASVSPPDEHGYCCFGYSIWCNVFYTRYYKAKTIIAQVDPSIPNIYGDTKINVSQIDWFVETSSPRPEIQLYKASDEEVSAIEIIGELCATLVQNRDCVLPGAGGVSQRMMVYLGDRQDLGYHAEVMLSGFPPLVEAGIFNGKYKTTNPGKAVAAEFLKSAAEEAVIANNPAFEFYGIEYTDDPKIIASNDNVVAINNAVTIDLSGQVCSEAIGSRQYTGTGGQLDFHLGGLMSRGGRSITVLPATFRAKSGELGSRIVPAFDPATPVTVPRTLTQWVITEYGMVNLMGRTLRERAEDIISLAHPDFRAELRKEFHKLPWW